MGNIFQKKEFWRGEIINAKFHRVRLQLIREDNEEYQKNYPNAAPDDMEANNNYLFYKNEIPSQPEGDYIENILTEWADDFVKLEKHHGYIQWLFPTRERGHNALAQLLQGHEAEKIANDPEAKDRVRRAYEMMLNFYGLKLVNLKRGTLEKNENWEERWNFLNNKGDPASVGDPVSAEDQQKLDIRRKINEIRSMHNYLRITRILRALGDLGWENLKMGFVNFLFEEVMINRTLPNAIESMYDYWIPTLRDPNHRRVFYHRFATMTKFYPEMYKIEKKKRR